MGRKANTPEVFWSRVNKNGPVPEYRPDLGPCWIWTRAFFSTGYGTFSIKHIPRLTHKVAYELVKGSVPEGLELDHLCRIRACCNPDHLEPVTKGENVLRGMSFSGLNRLKTHCPRDHELVPGNLSVYKLKIGKRSCLTCEREYKRQLRRNERVAA